MTCGGLSLLQEHPPARQGLSDFTVCDDLGVHVEGLAFDHRLVQFALAHSGWRHVTVSPGGESIALSTGLQAALWRLGGVPEADRTHSLAAAFNNVAVCADDQARADIAHKLKSAARVTGAVRPGQLCAEIEETAATNPRDAVLDPLLVDFDRELQAVHQFLDRRTGEQVAASGNSRHQPQASTSDPRPQPPADPQS